MPYLYAPMIKAECKEDETLIEIQAETSSNRAKILVLGIGGCGNNALTRMSEHGIEGIELIGLNTDVQDLDKCKCDKKLQIGEKLTKGLGAGAIPETGEKAAEESREQIEEAIKDADMVILTCGMGGGTGTGATPLVASIAKAMDKLTVAIVTKPFKYEGKPRMQNALEGIEKLQKNVDTMIVVPNDKLMSLMDKNISYSEGLRKADDEVLLKTVMGVTDLIYKTQEINLDFADIKTAMTNKGIAHIGIGIGRGDNKAKDAVNAAVENPLLETSIEGASDILVGVSGDCSFVDVSEAFQYVESLVGDNTRIFNGYDKTADQPGEIKVTIIATGITQMAPDKKIVPNKLGLFNTPVRGNMPYAGNPVENFKMPTSIYSGAAPVGINYSGTAGNYTGQSHTNANPAASPMHSAKELDISIPNFLKRGDNVLKKDDEL